MLQTIFSVPFITVFFIFVFSLIHSIEHGMARQYIRAGAYVLVTVLAVISLVLMLFAH